MELGVAVFILILPFLSTTAQSIRFEIESGQAKCISEDIRINSMTVGHYSVVNPNEGHPLPEHHKIVVAVNFKRPSTSNFILLRPCLKSIATISDSICLTTILCGAVLQECLLTQLFSGNEKRYHHAELVESGQFAFHVEEDGKHMLCFKANSHEPPVNTTVEFNWRSGVSVKDWTNVATKDSLEEMEVELQKMEETVTLIHKEMFYLREREREMQELIKYINSIMGYMSLVSLFICLSVAALQLWHLKSFFEKKKII